MDLDQLASYAGATETPPYQRLVKDSTRHNQLRIRHACTATHAGV